MAFSVNTNPGAFLALQTLSATNKALGVTQNRISTGLAVASAKDGASTYAIAQKIRGDVGGLNASKASLDRAISAVDVGISAAESVSDLLVRARELAVAGADAGLDAESRTALSDEYVEIVAQIDSIVNSADFNGTNMVNEAFGVGTGAQVGAIDKDGGSVFTISSVDLTAATLGLSATGFADATAAAAEVTAIDTDSTGAMDVVNSALSTFGAGSQRLEIQQSFTTKLQDALNVGIGNLVDADMAKESANLQALQVKQQLGLQALAIANQAPGAILSLF